MSFIQETTTGSSQTVARILLKQRLIKHYNDTAMRYLDKAIGQAASLKKQSALRSNGPVKLKVV